MAYMKPSNQTVLIVANPRDSGLVSTEGSVKSLTRTTENCFILSNISCFQLDHGLWIPFVSEATTSWEGVRPGFLAADFSLKENGDSVVRKSGFDSENVPCTEITMDPHLASRIVYCLLESEEFRSYLNGYLREKYPHARKYKNRPALRVVLDWSLPNKFDEPWEQRIWTLCMWNELVREHLAWLSTLGGAFSSLGKIGFNAFAEKAGKISVSQWRLSTYIGDPVLSCRSRIFFAVSLIQQRRFRIAQDILRNELQFSRTGVVSSEAEKLESIIRSVWAYLVHEKQQRRRSLEEKRTLKERAARLMFDDGTIRAKKSLADTILAISNVKLPQGC